MCYLRLDLFYGLFIFLVADMDKNEIKLIKFNGKNYTSWSYQIQVYLEGKEMWGLVSGEDPRPKEDEKKILSWNTKDAKVKT